MRHKGGKDNDALTCQNGIFLSHVLMSHVSNIEISKLFSFKIIFSLIFWFAPDLSQNITLFVFQRFLKGPNQQYGFLTISKMI